MEYPDVARSVLLFDKSTLESLSVNEAHLLDNFYRATITPLFFVECLADLGAEDGSHEGYA